MSDEIQIFSNLKQALNLYRITSKEVDAIQAYSKEAFKHVDKFIDAFYLWIPGVPEFKSLFSRPGLIVQVKKSRLNIGDSSLAAN